MVCMAFAPCALLAQEAPAAPALRNSGAPIQMAFHCTDDDMQWAGMTCSDEEPCPVYLELAHAAGVGQKVFLTGDIHSQSNTLYSILIASEDGGASWSEPYTRIRGAELDGIQFLDFEKGWISGQMLQPLPGDAFLLLTTDGGKTWRRRAVLEEGSPGSIVAFRFDSRKSGSLIMDRGQSGGNRYQLYESETGGESWTIRETSAQQLKLRGIEDTPAWRIRADAVSKAFRIEKREGETWRNVAGFALKVGECKPEARTETPPPADVAPVAPKTDDFVQELRLGGAPANAPKKKKPK